MFDINGSNIDTTPRMDPFFQENADNQESWQTNQFTGMMTPFLENIENIMVPIEVQNCEAQISGVNEYWLDTQNSCPSYCFWDQAGQIGANEEFFAGSTSNMETNLLSSFPSSL